jgi:hypothetical protein
MMSSLKPLVLAIFAWGIIAVGVRADGLTWTKAASDGWAPYLAQLNSSTNSNIISFNNPPPIPAAAVPPVSAVPVTTTIQANSVSNIPPSTTPAAPFSAAAVSAGGPLVDGFINVGNGPYPNAALITTGGAQPWYNSSQLGSFFGGQPTAQQQQSFDNAVLQNVQQTFAGSGVPITLTSNPNVPALHTISLVSNTGSASLSSAIGMTAVGASGFSFIDKIAQSAQNLSQLELIVAHNISHELMLALGVPETYDQTGNYVDSKVASWSMMVNPNAVFSPAASQALIAALQNQSTEPGGQLGAQALNSPLTPAPEPATIGLWVVAAAAALVARHIRGRRAAA